MKVQIKIGKSKLAEEKKKIGRNPKYDRDRIKKKNWKRVEKNWKKSPNRKGK